MKIALLTDGIYPYVIGGMQKHSHYLAAYLARSGVKVTLVHCLASGKKLPELEDLLKDLGIEGNENIEQRVMHFPKAGFMPGHYLKESFNYSERAFKSIESELDEFDLIYAKGFSSWYLLDKKRKGLKTPPVAIKFHGYEMFQDAPSFKVKMEHWMLRGPVKFHHKHCDFVFSYGGKITSLVEELGVSRNRIMEVPTGIAAEWVRTDNIQKKEGKRKFVFIGRYERRKGVEELNEALKGIADRDDFEMHFIGPIPGSKLIKSDSIIYHGKIMEKEKIQAIIDECEVLITPSHSEGMPNVIMEGMARGLAVIATDVGAVAAQVGEENGWMVKPGNAADLQKTMEMVIDLNDSDLLLKRQASIEKIKNGFTWEKVIEQTISAFQRIIAQGTSS